MERWNKEQAGVYFDSSRGIHVGREVLELCLSLGMETDSETIEQGSDSYHEHYHEVWADCEYWLNTHIANIGENCYFGSNENGDWGYFEASQELSFWR